MGRLQMNYALPVRPISGLWISETRSVQWPVVTARKP